MDRISNIKSVASVLLVRMNTGRTSPFTAQEIYRETGDDDVEVNPAFEELREANIIRPVGDKYVIVADIAGLRDFVLGLEVSAPSGRVLEGVEEELSLDEITDSEWTFRPSAIVERQRKLEEARARTEERQRELLHAMHDDFIIDDDDVDDAIEEAANFLTSVLAKNIAIALSHGINCREDGEAVGLFISEDEDEPFNHIYIAEDEQGAYCTDLGFTLSTYPCDDRVLGEQMDDILTRYDVVRKPDGTLFKGIYDYAEAQTAYMHMYSAMEALRRLYQGTDLPLKMEYMDECDWYDKLADVMRAPGSKTRQGAIVLAEKLFKGAKESKNFRDGYIYMRIIKELNEFTDWEYLDCYKLIVDD